MSSPDAAASALLGSPLRVTLTDGRVLLGRLHAIDWQQNIVLRDTELWLTAEARARETRAEAVKRHLGLVAVSAQHVVAYEQRAEVL